ncbi:MAG TPA: hypothetical protein VIY86_05835, partial [Pirellulaceae bacterium]
IEEMIPEPGAMMSFTFLTDRGFEGYSENWAENKFLETSEPLDILKHTGGDPAVVFAGNARKHQDDLGTKWLGRIAYYVETLLLKKELDEDQWELYSDFRDGLLPLWERYQKVTTDHWNKAFESGQFAFVMDTKLEAKPMWHFLMPPASQPLPMLEFALVYPLTDRSELETALDKYRDANEAMLDKIKELFREHRDDLAKYFKGPAASVPAVIESARMPVQQEREVEDGKVVYGTGLQKAGVDSALAPCMGWNSGTYVLAMSPETAERLLESQEIEGPLGKTQGKKLASASRVDFDRLVGFFRPWIDYGFAFASARADEDDEDEIKEITDQVHTILDVMQCFDQCYSITFAGDDSLVTHFRADFKDLEEE